MYRLSEVLVLDDDEDFLGVERPLPSLSFSRLLFLRDDLGVVAMVFPSLSLLLLSERDSRRFCQPCTIFSCSASTKDTTVGMTLVVCPIAFRNLGELMTNDLMSNRTDFTSFSLGRSSGDGRNQEEVDEASSSGVRKGRTWLSLLLLLVDHSKEDVACAMTWQQEEMRSDSSVFNALRTNGFVGGW
jgi:hypothetical protein